jgi:cytochrome c oxidase subunit II
MPAVRRHQLAQMLVIGVIASAIGITLALSVDWFPVPGTTQAKKIDSLFDVLLIASVPIFVFVEVVVLFSVWKFRMRPGDELKDGPPIHGHTLLEVVWTAIPATLLIGLCTYAFVTLRNIERKPKAEMVVNVTGQQFAWSFAYPGAHGARSISSNQLYLPEGRSIEFRVRSKDVIHDFWVPQFRMKIDAVPGITTRYRVTPIRDGAYPVVCAELCGLGHSTMRQTAHVLPAREFDAWMQRKQAQAQAQTTKAT